MRWVWGLLQEKLESGVGVSIGAEVVNLQGKGGLGCIEGWEVRVARVWRIMEGGVGHESHRHCRSSELISELSEDAGWYLIRIRYSVLIITNNYHTSSQKPV